MAERNAAQRGDEIGPSPDAMEYTTGASAIPFTELGGGPIRRLEIVSGGPATIACKTKGGGATTRTFTLLADGSKLDALQIMSILGTGDGTTNSVVVRAYK